MDLRSTTLDFSRIDLGRVSNMGDMDSLISFQGRLCNVFTYVEKGGKSKKGTHYTETSRMII